MKEYWVYYSGWFETTEEEILSLKRMGYFTQEIYKSNLLKLQKYFNGEKRNHEKMFIVDYTIRCVPEKRNNCDCSVLLCVKLSNGDFLAKRHNNSQWLSLEW